MPIRRKVIKVPRGTVEKLCIAQRVGRTTVYEALNGNNNSEDAKKIRQLALSTYGGVETTKVIFQ